MQQNDSLADGARQAQFAKLKGEDGGADAGGDGGKPKSLEDEALSELVKDAARIKSGAVVSAIFMSHIWTVVQHDGPNHLECGQIRRICARSSRSRAAGSGRPRTRAGRSSARSSVGETVTPIDTPTKGRGGAAE